MHSKSYRIYNKHTRTIEESIHVLFDESNDNVLSGSIVQGLHLNKHNDDEEEASKEEDNINEHPQEWPLKTGQREDILSQQEEQPTSGESSPLDVTQEEATREPQRHYKYEHII